MKNMTLQPALMSAVASALLAISPASMAAPDPAAGYQWVNASECKTPKPPPVSALKESHGTYNIQRRLIDLGGDGTCEVLDFWIERLGGSDAAGMRTLEHQFLVYRAGHWQPFVAEIRHFPYLLRRQPGGQLVVVDVVRAEDVGDDMAAGDEGARVLESPAWAPPVPGSLPSLSFRPAGERSGEALQALAVLMARKLAPASGKAPGDADMARIRWLMDLARQTLPKDKLVPLGPDGLPAPGVAP